MNLSFSPYRFPRGFPIADLVNEGREVTETLAGWFDRSMRDSRGFVYPFDEEIIPEGLRDAGEEMANLVTDALEGDEEAIASIGDERMAALIAAGAASKRLPFEIPFTREQAKIFISTEIQQMIVRILEDNPEERDVLLKQIDEAPISTKLRTHFHDVVDDEAKQARGNIITDLSYGAWEAGKGVERWLQLNTMKFRGFQHAIPADMIPAGLADVGGDMTALLEQVASEDPAIREKAMDSINLMRTSAHVAASYVGPGLLDEGKEFTKQGAKILYAYAAAGDWGSYRILRYVEEAEPKMLEKFGVDLTPLKVNWQKPAVYTGAAVAGVGASATGVWGLSQVLKSSPPDGITFETQQSIIQILRDYPDDKDVLLKLIDDTPNITPEQRVYFHSIAEEAKKPTEQGRNSRS
ncbi:hypothetical protein FRB99_003462 [Tulasnella sp. 403]|nr:hypothetical protein FRB99_003462 [Tulasnella sp. 403]